MVFGMFISPFVVEYTGLFVLLFVLFEVLVGLRKIRFPRRSHLKIHKYLGYALLGVAVVHGLLALAYLNGWSIF